MMFLNDIFSQITGFLSGLFTSSVFLYLMYRQKPKLQLSQHIAKTVLEGKNFYAIKVINMGRRDILSIQAELLLVQPQPVEGGIGYNIIEISLARNTLFLIQPMTVINYH